MRRTFKHNFAGHLAKLNIKKIDDQTILKREEERKEYIVLDKLIKEKNYRDMIHFIESVCEGKNAIREAGFYFKALRELTKLKPAERYYLHVESVAQSAAIAGINDERIYTEAIDYILNQTHLNFVDYPIIQPQNIESACRVLASIAIANQHRNEKIKAESAFKLAFERLRDSSIANEKRVEEKPNRIVEILEQALDACLDPEFCRALYEDVYIYIKENEKLSDEYKIKTLAEITAKTIKTPNVSHTKLFTETIKFLKEKRASNLARSMHILLDIYKK